MAKKAKTSSKPPSSSSMEKTQNKKHTKYANVESIISQLPGLSKISINQKFDPALYIISTPIGNLMDISLRSLAILNEADLIAAEDTRVTRKLLSYFEIKTSMISYNDNSTAHVRKKIVKLISENKLVALVSDAGTPLISDPGFKLVKECIRMDLKVVSVPGPTAFISALVSSGIEPSPVTFIGFLPSKKNPRNKKLHELSKMNSTIVIFISGRNLVSTMEEMFNIFGERTICVARELTKIHEEVFRGKLSKYIMNNKNNSTIKGEITLIVSRGSDSSITDNIDHLDNKIKKELKSNSLKKTVDVIKATTDLPKKIIYNRALELKKRFYDEEDI